MKTLALTKDEVYSKSTYQEYLNNTKELTVLVEPVNDTFTILGIFKDHISHKCHELLHYYELVSKKPLIIPSCTFLHTILDNISSVHIYQTSTGVTKWRGINLSAYDNGSLNSQPNRNVGKGELGGLCTDEDGSTGGWFYTTETKTGGSPIKVGGATYPTWLRNTAHTGSPLHEIDEPTDPDGIDGDAAYATSFPVPSQIMAAYNAGVNIFRVPFMPQFIVQIATGWAKEGFTTSMKDVYKPGNCLYFSFYMATVQFILDYAKTGFKPNGVRHPNWPIANPHPVKVIIDCHSYMRWGPMNILATSGALDGPPNRKYSMDQYTDLRCPYTLNVSDPSNNAYINAMSSILGPPSGWTSNLTAGKINWNDINGILPSDDNINENNIINKICKGATNQANGFVEDDASWDMNGETTFCTSNRPDENQCYGGPTKTVLGINCLPILWYKLLHTKFYPCLENTCIPVSAPTPAPAPTPACAVTEAQCYSTRRESFPKTCCSINDYCEVQSEWYAQCKSKPTPSPSPTPITNMCTQISKDIKSGGTTFLDFIRTNNDNIWLDLMNEPNQINTRDLGTAYGKVIKVLHAHKVTNKLLIEGNYWSGMHAQIFPGVSEDQGWTWKADTPPTYSDISKALWAYRGPQGKPPAMVDDNRDAYLSHITNSPVEILYNSISAELSRSPNPVSFSDVSWSLNLHQYMDRISSGGHGCYSSDQPLILDVSHMKVFTRFDAIEAWSYARKIPLIVTEFGAQLYTENSDLIKGCSFNANSIDPNEPQICSAGCEHKMNLFLEMMESSDRIEGWTIWRATPPVSYAMLNRTMIGGDSPVYGWSNGIVWSTPEIKQFHLSYKFLQNSVHLSSPYTDISSSTRTTPHMPRIATGDLWNLKGIKVPDNFWSPFTGVKKYPAPEGYQQLPTFDRARPESYKNAGYKQ